MARRRIVIGEHDRRTAQLLKRALERGCGAEACVAADGFGTVKAALEHETDLIVLDTALPDPDGIAVCRMLRARERTAHVPIVLISDQSAPADRVQGLRLGADDYLAKPFNVDELQLRVKAILRRYAPEPRLRVEEFECDNLKANFADVIVTVDGRPIHLTRREFDLLRYLVERRNRVLSHRILLRDVWHGVDVLHGTRTVALHIARLRSKLGSAGRRIETCVGRGYRFVA